MKESDIRPSELHEKVRELHDEDVKEIIKLKSEFVYVKCPACKEDETSYMFEKEKFKFVKCEECGTIYINPRPTVEMLTNFYANSKSMKYWNDVIFPATEESRKENIFQERADEVVKYCKNYINNYNILMDVGAGYGTFCSLIKEEGDFERVIAIEPSTKLAKTCEEKNIETINKPIEEVEMRKVDVITSFEVIEHLFNPVKFVKSCYDNLSENGLFIITTPNIRGFELSMLMQLSPNIGGPDHLNYYHPQSLKKLLKSQGFEVLKTITPGKLDAELVRKKVISGELNIEDDLFLKEILINRWDQLKEEFQDFLVANTLSSHLWVVARKK